MSMKLKAQVFFSILLAFSLLPMIAFAEDGIDLTDITQGDPFFYTSDQFIEEDDGESEFMGTGRPDKTHSQIPHLPFYVGYINTNYTYRFMNIAEQVLTMIGEGKHGLWRVQENGMVREYLRPGATGLEEGADIFTEENLQIVSEQYAAFLPGEASIYKFPDERLTEDNRLNYIDLPITHPKYGGKYDKHELIDLPSFYCTMSGPDYPYARQAMDFAFAQPGANEVGPLGKRAGLDIEENYTKVVRLNHMPDARSWVNVGQEGKDELHVKWKAIDTEKTKAEYYLFERPFFGTPYLFLTAVFDNEDNRDFEYVRPDGPYYESLEGVEVDLKTTLTQQPRFHLEGNEIGEAIGLPVYGVHHPNRAAYGGGGACPLRGGDWGRYPDTSGGSAWPTHYEEVTPLCDAILVDIKFYSNLDGQDWNDEDKYLANAGSGSDTVTYKMQPGEYGVFTDPYNVENGIENPERQDIPEEMTLTYPSNRPAVSYTPVPNADIDRSMLPTEGTTCRPIASASN